jgi:hypothetical protein
MLPHFIPLPHQFLQPWIKLRKCSIQNHNIRYIQLIHAYFTNYIHAQYTQEHLSLQLIDLPENQLITAAMYHVINIQTHYHGEIREKIKNHQILPISRWFLTKFWSLGFGPHPLSPTTELSAHSAEFWPYSAEFWAKAGDFWTRRPLSIACSSGGTTTLTGVLFCQHREKK